VPSLPVDVTPSGQIWPDGPRETSIYRDGGAMPHTNTTRNTFSDIRVSPRDNGRFRRLAGGPGGCLVARLP